MKKNNKQETGYPSQLKVRVSAEEYGREILSIQRKHMDLEAAENFMKALPKIMDLLNIKPYDPTDIEADNAAHGLG
jgi:hypothetical protein